VRSWLLILLLAIPWLNPMVLGPIPAMMQIIVTMLCMGCFVAYAGHTVSVFGKPFAALVAGAWMLAACLSAVLGLLQYFGVSAALAPWVSYTSAGEAYANLRQRNQFATLLNIGLASLLWSLPAGAGWFQARPQPAWLKNAARALVFSAAALLAAADAASASRTGLVQLLVIGALAVVWRRQDRPNGLVSPRHLVLVAVLAYAVASQVLPLAAGVTSGESVVWSRLKPAELTCNSRMVLWSNVLQIIAQKPWLGWGPDELAFAHFNTLYSGPRFCEILDNAHNLPLQLAVVVGVPATLALMLSLGWWLYRARPWGEVDNDRRLAWVVLALIALHSMLEYPLWYAPFQFAVLLCVLLLCGARWQQALLGSATAQALASVGLALCAYTTWDYWRISQIYLAAVDRAPAYQTETLEKIQGSLLFRNQVRFADLGLGTVTPENAQQVFDLSKDMLHFSPEPMVVEKILESARVLGKTDEIEYYRARFQAAYPDAYAQWVKTSAPDTAK
jgi:O-antigen ligase